MKNTIFVCACCREEHPVSQKNEACGELVCPSCLTEETTVCQVCGERIWNEDNAGSDCTPLCQRCYDHYYTTCERCERVIRAEDARYADEDEEDPLCEDCYAHEAKRQAIKDYYYKPEPIFYGKGPRFFGVELEIDEAGELGSNARQLLDIANGNGLDRLYCKHDGSLSSGFELVTHPMSLVYHTKEMPWAEILHSAVEMGYESHRARTCGLHIHVSRQAFGNTEEEQDAAIARVLYFFERHWFELLLFSRRTQRQQAPWAARYGYQGHPKDILEHAKKGCHAGWYTCVNLQPCETTEFRIFRGTLKYNTFLATLQLVDRICDMAIYLSDEEIRSLPWSAFAAACTQPELVLYLKERRLYVSDAVKAEEEI